MGDAQFDYKGRVLKSFSNEAEPIKASCVSPDDDFVVGCRGKTIIVWKFRTGEEYGKMEGHRSDISCCSMNDTFLATGSANGVVHLWKYKDLKRVARIGLPSGAVNTISISINGQFVGVSCCTKPRIYTICKDNDNSLLKGPDYKELVGHTKDVTDMKFSPTGNNVMTTSKDGTVRLWSATGECILIVELGKGEVLSASFCAGSTSALFLHEAGFCIWNMTEDKEEWSVDGGFMYACCNTSTKAIAAITTNARLTCYNLATKKETVKKGTAHTDDILSLVPCSSGVNFLTSGADGKLFLWE